MVPAGSGALAPVSQSPTDTRVRNPLMAFVVSFVTCGLYGLIMTFVMMAELKSYLNKEEIVPWHILIPFFNLFVLMVKVPDWVTEAKQRAGSRNPQSAGAIMYFPMWGIYFFTKDMNEVWDPMGTSS